jgi:uncharacterized protein
VTVLQALLLAGAGLIAGTASAMAGGASILTFPVLLAMGVPPLAANVTNSVGRSARFPSCARRVPASWPSCRR